MILTPIRTRTRLRSPSLKAAPVAEQRRWFWWWWWRPPVSRTPVNASSLVYECVVAARAHANTYRLVRFVPASSLSSRTVAISQPFMAGHYNIARRGEKSHVYGERGVFTVNHAPLLYRRQWNFINSRFISFNYGPLGLRQWNRCFELFAVWDETCVKWIFCFFFLVALFFFFLIRFVNLFLEVASTFHKLLMFIH